MLQVVVFMETRYIHKTLLAVFASDVKAPVQVQGCVFCVDMSLDLCIGWNRYIARHTDVLAFFFRSQIPHALCVSGFHVLFTFLRTHARACKLTGPLSGSGRKAGSSGSGSSGIWLNNFNVIHAVVVLTVKILVVLKKLLLRSKLHAVAEAAEIGSFYEPIMLIHTVSPYGGLFEELLRTVSADESLKAVTTNIAAVFADGNLRVKDILAHPAHPRLLYF